jgi:predicted transcriptional regulator
MTAVPFSLRLEADLKEAIEKEARLEDRSASYVIQQATREYVERKKQFRAMVAELEVEADKGIFVSGEAIDAWVESWDTEDELPPPGPDIFPQKAALAKRGSHTSNRLKETWFGSENTIPVSSPKDAATLGGNIA